MTKHYFTLVVLLALINFPALSQVTERQRPAEWENLVYGGRFMDRFLPMPVLGGLTSDTWGGKNVIPRDTNNGLEDAEWSYWGGNARLMEDGKYHLFVCRWREDSPKGHMEWPRSIVVHAVADNSFGPYKVISELGPGHNPEWYVTDTGKYVVYVIDGYYVSDDVNGPWTYNKYEFDSRDRSIIEGLSNLTFAKREDGSFVMVCRGGGVWVSKDGLDIWNQVTDARVYPPVDGRFEDPLIWKTDVQYHLIVNDWLGRIAWYLRSKDGINWKTDAGEAYMPNLAKYADGTKEDWFKYERIKVLQDSYGRATQAHFAVIDSLKHHDLPNDTHSSKHITIPLRVGKLLAIQNSEKITETTQEIVIEIKGEEGFNPNTDIDIKSLRFGASEEVSFGRGAIATNIESKGRDALITFEGKGNGITDANFAAKLLGKDVQGNMLFGYAKLPEVAYIEPTLSSRKPVIVEDGSALYVEIQNFGQVSSVDSSVSILMKKDTKFIEIGTSKVSMLRSFEKITLKIKTKLNLLEIEVPQFKVVFNKGSKNSITCDFGIQKEH